MKQLTNALIAASLVASLASCHKSEANAKPLGEGQSRVMATVNGVAVTEADVKRSVKRGGHGDKLGPQALQNMLQHTIRDELIYQQAVELGLDKDPIYRAKLDDLSAQLKAMQRQEMAVAFREHVRRQAKVSDAEAQAFYDQNSMRLRTRYHVWQIFQKGGEPRMAQDSKDLQGGKPFQEVAARRFPDLPPGAKLPWDLGALYWHQIPAPWQPVLDRLQPGQTSDLIKGPGERFWLIHLVEKRLDPGVTFASEKAKIVEVLQQQRSDELYETRLGQMKARARISFPK